ncbi:MAG: zinc ribbon domain-containing protein [Selenomonadaceae bacterium]|nr:zinc ribbon domain-containing protein [Selenomonadaceae bacterium]
MKFCYKCGQQLDDGDAFCCKCGANVSSINAPAKNSNTPIIALLVVFLVVAGVLAYEEDHGKKTSNRVAQTSSYSSREINSYKYDPPQITYNDLKKPSKSEYSNEYLQNLNDIKPPVSMPLPESIYTPINKNHSADDAKSVLIEYYTSIAEGRMLTAYNMLSYSMQDYMQSFQDFSQGHADVISNDVSDMKILSDDGNEVILNYKLTSRDKDSGRIRTQIFYGTATLNKISGDWIITDLNVRKGQ